MDFLQMLNDFFTKFDNILWGVPIAKRRFWRVITIF